MPKAPPRRAARGKPEVMRRASALLPVLALSLAACGGSEPESSRSTTVPSPETSSAVSATSSQDKAPESSDASAVAAEMKGKVSSITKIVTITEDNDPNDLIGRPNGYESAAVLYDNQASCTELGTECGATVETWPDAAAAKARADYIQAILKSSPALGSEWDYVRGNTLLRVSGTLKPSAADKYSATFGGEQVEAPAS